MLTVLPPAEVAKRAPRSLVALLLIFATGLSGLAAAPAANEPIRLVGVAKIDITPDYPIRLSGYGNRREESQGVEQHLWAKALAVGGDAEGPAVLVTVDNCGVPAAVRNEVLARLAKTTKVTPERFALSFSHTHCAPCLTGALVNIFSLDIPPEHQAHIDRYTRELTDRIEQVVLAALADRRPARLAWGAGSATFARNRRPQWGGPVDHALPVLFVTDPEGKLRAVFASYACHATTLAFNRAHGDWVGCAMEAIERDHPGAIALVALGCGADQNPNPRGTVELAQQHGESVAAEVDRLLQTQLQPIRGALTCRTKQIELPYDTLPTREEWEAKARDPKPAVAYHARKNLARLDRGEKLPTGLPYMVQAWTFGNDLAMVFLPGEVTVDYGLRLKNEISAAHLWVNAYSNDAPCYIPSRRVLAEGGYEGGYAMVYYDRPTQFAPAVEDTIVNAVHELVPKALELHGTAEMPLAKSPADSLAAMATKPGLQIDLAVAEPLVVDPVAIDWGPDGKLWVVEMRDYPMGMDGKYKPGGRIRLLEDTDGDGRYDKATVFLDNLPFPTGVMAWGKGVLICAAPDIIYAEDTKGTGHADIVRKIFTGFATDNYQARVNSLALGLDNWVHGANGLLGGVVHSANSDSAGVDISGRDFRMKPDTGEFEATAGVTQQGRARDDWDNWFGCDNSAFLFQFPLPDHYVRRNPHVPAPPSRLMLPADADPNIVYPASHALERFNSPESLNHVTSGCGLGLYRDTLPGADFSDDTFTCEPVHNLVHRLKLSPKGVVFEARRTADEQASEFLTSRDNWFRPVQVRTGPDGAMWVVDMYRFVIEHPRWIPPDKLAKLDVRAGDDKGRIYRIYPKGAKLRPIRDLTKLATPELVAALETPNGTTRDLVQMELLHRADAAADEPLVDLFHKSQLPAVRLQALCTLDGLDALTPGLLEQALTDANPAVRRHAVRLSEKQLAKSPDVAAACLKLVSDPDIGVRYQLALSLGEWNDLQAARTVGAIACTAPDDTWLRAAVLSSSAHQPLEVLKATLAAPGNTGDRSELAGGLIATAAGTAARVEDLGQLLTVMAPGPDAKIEDWQVIGLLHWQDAMDRRKAQVTDFLNSPDPAVRAAATEMMRVYAAAHQLAGDANADEALRSAAIRLFGRGFNDLQKDLPQLAAHLDPAAPLPLQKAALDTLARSRSDQAPKILFGGWARHGPAMRSAIIGTLLSRDEWTEALLNAVEKGVVAPSDIPTASRERLAKHANESIRKHAMALLPNRPSDRAAVVAKYQVVANLQGHAEKGATVFKNICSVCHNYLGQGQEVGPKVTTFRNKSVQDFLIAILDPNAAVEPRYTAYSVQTKDGRSLYGVISSESATTLVITQPGGVRETILRSDIATLTSSARSLMPDGLEQAISPQELADLIAYLKGGG